MEQQKILWIVFSVALFLLIVVVVGFVWFLPPTDASASPHAAVADRPRDPIAYDPIEWTRRTEDVPAIEVRETVEDDGRDDLLVIIGEDRPRIVRRAEELEAPPVAETRAVEPARAVGPATRTEAVRVVETPTPEIVRAQREEPRVGDPPPRAEPASPAAIVAPAKPAPAATVAPAKPAPAAVRPPPAAPRTERVTQYWIQAGSFSSRARAEEAQNLLGARGWSARIISRDVEGSLFFRVRIGPYESEKEAEKFLAWLADIEPFGGSYISQVYTTRTLN